MFVIGFVFVFVILKGKIINLKLLYEISGKHKIDIYKYIYIYIYIFYIKRLGHALSHGLGALE